MNPVETFVMETLRAIVLDAWGPARVVPLMVRVNFITAYRCYRTGESQDQVIQDLAQSLGLVIRSDGNPGSRRKA